MRSIPLVMTWDMLRRGWWLFVALTLGANALPFLLFAALLHDGAIDPGDQTSVMLHAMLIEINLLMCGAAVFSAVGSPARLYTCPIRTASLVLVLMLQAMVAIAAELVLSTVLLNVAFGLQWPVLGPALFAAVMMATMLAGLWLFEKSGWAVLAMGLTVLGLAAWFQWHEGIGFVTSTRLWTVVTPGDLLTLGLSSMAAYAVAVAGVSRNRCGQPPLSLGIVAWFRRTFSTTSSPIGRPFQTPAGAQLWFEWGQGGWAMPVVAATYFVLGLLLWLICSRKVQDLDKGLVAGGALISGLSLFVGFVLGRFGIGSDPDLKIGQFLATRPLTSTEMARAVLKCGAISLLVTWTIWAASFFALAATLWAFEVKFPLGPAPLGWWYFPVTLVGAWAAMSLSTPLVMTGRKGFAGTIVIGSMVFTIGLMVFSTFALSRDGQDQFIRGVLLVVGIMLAAGTVWAFIAAVKRSLIGTPTVFVAASAWGFLGALVAVFGMSHHGQGIFAYILAGGILALAVSPLATAPLALAWNRNR